MGFGFHHAAWLDQWCAITNEEWSIAFGHVEPPNRLYHYTGALKEIIESGCLWSVALTDQDDPEELSHGVQLVSEAIERLIKQDRASFMANVLRLVPDMIASRKKHTFVTCFCAGSDSEYHRTKYGSDRLEFCTFGRESLNAMRTFGHGADILLFRVIYDEGKQVATIEKLLETLIGITPKFLNGDYLFQSAERAWIEGSIGRDIGQLFLDFLVGFKRKQWADDQEWRLLCRPALKIGSTAPKMADEDFSVAICGRSQERGNLLRVELRLPTKNMKCGLPLTAINHFGSENDLEHIHKLLASRWYEGVKVALSSEGVRQ